MLWIAQQALRMPPGALQADTGASAIAMGGAGSPQLSEAALDPAAMAMAAAAAAPAASLASPSGGSGSPDATANQQLLQEQRRQEQMVWMGELPLPLEMLAWCPGAYTAPVTAAAGQPSDGGATAASCRPAAAAVLGSNPCWARFACDDASTLTSLTAPFLCASLPAGAANPNTITDASIEITADGWYGAAGYDESPPPPVPAPPGDSGDGAGGSAGGVLGQLWRQGWRASTQEGVLGAPPLPPSPPRIAAAAGPSAANATFNASATPSASVPAPGGGGGCPRPNGDLSGCAASWKLGDPFEGLAQVMSDNGITAAPPPPGQHPPAPPRQSWLASSKGGIAVLAVATFCGALVVIAVTLAAYIYLFLPATSPGTDGTTATGGAAAATVGAAAGASAENMSPEGGAGAADRRSADGRGRAPISPEAAVAPKPIDTPTRCENGELGAGLFEDRPSHFTTITSSRRTISSCGSEATARTSPASDPRTSTNSNRSRVLPHAPLHPLVVADGCGGEADDAITSAPAVVAARTAPAGWCAEGGESDVVAGLPRSVADAARSSYSWRRRGGGSWRERSGTNANDNGSSSSSPSGDVLASLAGVAGGSRAVRPYGASDDGCGGASASIFTAAAEAATLPPNAIASPSGGGAHPSLLPAVTTAAADAALPPAMAAAAAAAAGTPQAARRTPAGTGVSPRSWRNLRASTPNSGGSANRLGGSNSGSSNSAERVALVAVAGIATGAATATAAAPAAASGGGNAFSLYTDLLAESLELRRRRRSCVALELRAETPRGGDKV